jgi:hypothetical protein
MDKKKILLIVSIIILVLATIIGVTLYLVLRKKNTPKPSLNKEVFFIYFSPPDKYPNKLDIKSWLNSVSGRIANYQDICQAYSSGSSVCAFGETVDGSVYYMATEYVRDQCFRGQNLGVCKNTDQSQGYFIYGYKPNKSGSLKIGENTYTTINIILPFRTEESKKYWFSKDYTSFSGNNSLNTDDCSCQLIPPDSSELILVNTNAISPVDIINWATPLGYYPVPYDKLCDAYKNGFETCYPNKPISHMPGISTGASGDPNATIYEIGQGVDTGANCVKGVCKLPSEPTYIGVFIYYVKPVNPTDKINFMTYSKIASDIFFPWNRNKWSKYSSNSINTLKVSTDSDCNCSK